MNLLDLTPIADLDEYNKAWTDAERDATIYGFSSENPWGWALSKNLETPMDDQFTKITILPSGIPSVIETHDEFTRADFTKALKRVSRKVKK